MKISKEKIGLGILIISFLILFFTIASSCKNKEEEKEQKIVIHKVKRMGYNDFNYQITIIDSCEYIVGWGGAGNGGPMLTHKGNCKFCK
jgi:hypothetical protein